MLVYSIFFFIRKWDRYNIILIIIVMFYNKVNNITIYIINQPNIRVYCNSNLYTGSTIYVKK